MKKSLYKIIFHLYSIFFIAFIILMFIFIGLLSYSLRSSISSTDRLINWSSWPVSYTDSFRKNIEFINGKPELKASGIDELKKYRLSFQIVDENGYVVISYNSPHGALHYSPIEIVELYKGGGSSGNCTMFVGSVSNNKKKWTYIIGFPAKISKLTVYVNYNFASKVRYILSGMFAIILLLIAIFGIKINGSLSNIIKGIERLASNNYKHIKEKGLYRDIYASLNLLDERLKASETERKRNEKLREEWIANISHDLKTPLSPIKGYAEILADSEYNVTSEEIKKYGAVILKNSKNIENIVENLNFTYQLKNGMIPIDKESGNIVRLLKEVIIDILNRPEYENRHMEFYCDEDAVILDFDNTLLKRAFNNLIYNAVIHNDDDTIIKVTVKKEDKIYVTIEDNGKGMSEEELKRLFERYYRGTNSTMKVHGSGLGMAIAKQIIEAHGGRIYVISKINIGTTINIEFPEKIKMELR